MILIFTGLTLLLSQIAISWLSHSFVFGTGHGERPIIPFLLLELMAFIVYWIALKRKENLRWTPSLRGACLPAGRRRRRSNDAMGFSEVLQHKKISCTWIFLIAILCRLVFIPSSLIQETDPYRYIWDGETVLGGGNPYERAPADDFTVIARSEATKQSRVVGNPNGIASSAFGLLAMTEKEKEEIYQKINHSGVKTIYPPLAQILFTVSQALSPWKLTAWKFMIFMAEVLVLLLMMLILTRLKIPKEQILVYAWSPLILKEFSNSLHLDIFAVLCLCLALYSLTRNWIWPAYLALALATLVKLFPVLLLPLVLAFTWKKNQRDSLLGLVLFVLTVILFYLQFAGAGKSLFEGLGQFAIAWKVNAGLFSLLEMALGSVGARITAFLILLGGVAASAYWLKQKADIISFVKASLFVCALLFFLAPAGNPWYFSWLFPFLVIVPVRSLILFSGLVFLYYLDFYFMYQRQPELFAWVRLVEYGVFFAFLGVELWTKKFQSQSFFPSPTRKILLPERSAI